MESAPQPKGNVDAQERLDKEMVQLPDGTIIDATGKTPEEIREIRDSFN